MNDELEFKPIDLVLHQAICLKFREDSFVCSFGDAKRFYEEDGQGHLRYLEWLKQRLATSPKTCIHVWLGTQIIGQIEIKLDPNEPNLGYVNLYYLAPECRGKGLSWSLDEYTTAYFKSIGCSKIRLSVSPTNRRAWKYYEKNGWRDVDPRPGHPEVHFMEKMLERDFGA